MSAAALHNYQPDISNLITEDDTPVDNILSEKQQRLLTEPLYSSWEGMGDERNFVALANVGVFYMARNPAIVPDVLFSADVEMPDDFSHKENRSYFLWEFGKAPDIAIEIVSNKVGKEDGEKKQIYARMRIEYYVIYDPLEVLMPQKLTVYRLRGWSYEPYDSTAFPEFNLALTLWEGEFERHQREWLRWTNSKSEIILTGKELAAQERLRADAGTLRAEQEKLRADRLAEKLRTMGVDPTQV